MAVGNHTFAAVRGGESYELLKLAFRPAIEEVNAVIADPFVEVDGKRIKLDIVLGSDYKVQLVIVCLHS